MWLLFKKQTNTHKNSVRKRNISERHLEYKHHMAGLLNVIFEILGTFIILMEVFCTDIDELFRMSQEVVKQPSWKSLDTVAKMVSNSQNVWFQLISNCFPLPVALRTTHH